MKDEERRMILEKEYTRAGVMDAWWNGADEKSIADFEQAIKLTEERFLGQPGLVTKIENSAEVDELSAYANAVMKKMAKPGIENVGYSFTPPKPVDDIPLKWFQAAEAVITEKGVR